MNPSTALQFGPYTLPGRLALSPMAEFTNWPQRLLCQEHGAAFACTEMVKAKFVAQRHADTLKILERHPDERLCGGQICGSDEAELAAAAQILTRELGYHFVDFNIACPIRRIVADGAGGGLLATPHKVEKLVRLLAEAAAPAPVSVKMRSGLDENSINAEDNARAAEAGGARLIAVHPRTVRQGYGGLADHAVLARVKAAVRVPVVGGGDVRGPADAQRLLNQGACDVVYFGRGAVGNPWIFSRSAALIEQGRELPEPAPTELFRQFRQHAAWLVEHMGEHDACRHLRKLSREYAKRLPSPVLQGRFYDSFKELERFEDVAGKLGFLAQAIANGLEA